jgi:hypothetical protein
MKKIFFLVFSVIYSISAVGQQTITLNNLVSVTLPKGVEKVSKEQAITHVNTKFHTTNKMLVNLISTRNKASIYKIDDVLVSLFTDNHSVQSGHLLKIKKGFDEMSAIDKTYTSTLKKINNNSVLIMSSIRGGTGRYNFTCYNSSNTKATTGIIEFNNEDRDEASNILNQILNSIKF